MDFVKIITPVSFTRAKAGEVPAPTTTRSRNRRVAALREAAAILEHLPGPGEALHAIMTGRYDLTDLLEVLLDRLGPVDHMRVATLSYNRHNVGLLSSWVRSGRVKALTVLYSSFFARHAPEVILELREDVPSAHLAAARNHCKVVTMDFTQGERRKLVLEGSANLRTNSNAEQFCLIDDPGLYSWHSAYIDDQVSKHQGGTP